MSAPSLEPLVESGLSSRTSPVFTDAMIGRLVPSKGDDLVIGMSLGYIGGASLEEEQGAQQGAPRDLKSVRGRGRLRSERSVPRS